MPAITATDRNWTGVLAARREPNNWTAVLRARRASTPAAEPEPIPYAELRQLAKAAGLNANGSRAELEERLAALEEG